MAYSKQTWANGPDGGTPLSADRLGHIEDGIEAAAQTADAALPKTGGTVTSDLTVAGTLKANGVTDWVNVKTYGATGDGTTDDTSAIQAAIDAAADGGGVVYLPAGTYSISAALTISSDVALCGAGMDASTIEQTAEDEHGVYGADVGRVVLRDLRISGPVDGLTLGDQDGVFFEQTGATPAQNLCMENVFIDHFSRHGVNVEDPVTSTFLNVLSQNNGGYGFSVSAGTSLAFVSCYANGCLTGGWSLTSTSYSSLISCAVDSATGNAYLLTGCNSVALHGCGCEDIGDNQYEISGGSNVTLTSCYSSGNDDIGYLVTGNSAQAMLINCRERNPGGNATASVRVASGSDAYVVGGTFETATSFVGPTREFRDGTLTLDHTGTAINAVDRGAATNFAAYVLRTAGVDQWTLQLKNDSTNDVELTNSNDGGTALLAESRATAPNLSLLSNTKSYGGGVGVIHIANASTVPTTAPTGGGILYVEDGSLKFKGSGGKVTTIAEAGP